MRWRNLLTILLARMVSRATWPDWPRRVSARDHCCFGATTPGRPNLYPGDGRCFTKRRNRQAGEGGWGAQPIGFRPMRAFTETPHPKDHSFAEDLGGMSAFVHAVDAPKGGSRCQGGGMACAEGILHMAGGAGGRGKHPVTNAGPVVVGRGQAAFENGRKFPGDLKPMS